MVNLKGSNFWAILGVHFYILLPHCTEVRFASFLEKKTDKTHLCALGDISYFFGCHITTVFHLFFLLFLEMSCKVLETQ